MATALGSINSMATAAARAVWGEGKSGDNEEPVSGKQGDTSKGEPYDAGNMENPPVTPGEQAGPTATKDSSTTKGDSSGDQHDVRDPSDPDTDPRNAEAKKDVDDSGEGPNDVKVDGPRPRPLGDMAREHGGDAGVPQQQREDGGQGQVGGEAQKGTGGEDEEGPQKESKGEGSGTQYIKSTGLHADGGDFDATKAGAGREADRLMEQKGMDHTPGPISKTSEDKGSSSGGDSPTSKEKKSLRVRIKDKLHRK